MRICIVTSMAGIGGTENVSTRLIHLLKSKNNNVFLISGNGPLVNSELKSNANWIDLDFYKDGLLGYLKSTLKLIHQLQKNKFDVFDCQMARPIIACMVAKLICRSKVKIIWHSRGLPSGTYRWICPLYSFMKIHAIGNCKREREKLINYGYKRNLVSYSYNPIPKIPVQPKKKKSNAFVIGTLSRLSKDRGVDEVLYILRELLNKNIEAKIIIGGDGPELGHLKELSNELNVSDYVNFVGRVSDLNTFFGVIDVLANTIQLTGDNGAGIGNNIIESATFKVPVISYDSMGISEAVVDGQGGYCIPIGNRELFVKRLCQLANNEELRQSMGLKLHDHINKICSEDEIYNHLLECYSSKN